MLPPDIDAPDFVEKLNALSRQDRSAIKKHLSKDENKKLKALLKAHSQMSKRKDIETEAEDELSLGQYSPWLTKRLKDILDTPEDVSFDEITPATRQAIPELIKRQNEGNALALPRPVKPAKQSSLSPFKRRPKLAKKTG